MANLINTARSAIFRQATAIEGARLSSAGPRISGITRSTRVVCCIAVSRRRAALGLGAVGLVYTAANTVRAPVALAATKRSPVEDILDEPNFPPAWPYGKNELTRYDETQDSAFYSSPRFVTHIDDAAIGALTKYYEEVFPASGSKDSALLDICSSWISHYPKGYSAGKISGLGMNEEELKRNSILSDFVVKDLNLDPKLPYPDNSFDVVTNAVSVDYLVKPLEVMKEVNRVLKPGGLALMSFSNRCFPTKAIAIWTSTGDADHCWIVGSYFHYAGGYTKPAVKDISPNPGRSDPMYVVYARKSA